MHLPNTIYWSTLVRVLGAALFGLPLLIIGAVICAVLR